MKRALRRFFLGTWRMSGFLSEERPIRTMREILKRLQDTYCSTIGYEVRVYAWPNAALEIACALLLLLL